LVAGVLLVVAGSAPAQFAYEARIEGVVDPEFALLLEAVAKSLVLGDDPPASLLHLRRRADRDVERFLDVFHSRGFYGAEVSLDVNRQVSPIEIVFSAVPGAQYHYGSITLEGFGQPEDEEYTSARDALGLTDGDPALAEPITAANGKLIAYLRNHGYPAPKIAKRDVVVDHAASAVDVIYRLETGPRATFGEAHYEGLSRVRPVVVDKLLPWTVGDSFDQRQVTALRTALYDTGLFATAAVDTLSEEIGDDGVAPVRVEVTERPPRTISTGLEFKSDEGVGAQLRWENRNMRGLGHTFSVETTLATELREIDLRYHVDRFRRLDQALSASFLIAQEEREAFDSDRVQALAFVEREVNPRLTLAAGAGIRIGRVEKLGETDTHELLYFPLELRLDQSDDPLDPTRGFKFRARLEPYIDPVGELAYFTKTDFEFSYYLAFGSFETAEKKTLPNWVVASRMRFGAILGESRDDIPADIRFYGGGGGSIRGYRFQTVSPLVDDDPIGGASLGEFSVELRRRLSESLGIVAFVDGGAAFEDNYPGSGGDIQLGAGLGVRYYTPLGPLRFDVAVPLNKRSEIDDAFQIYMSIGHAF
jgi:translocation and assembly module TamA